MIQSREKIQLLVVVGVVVVVDVVVVVGLVVAVLVLVEVDEEDLVVVDVGVVATLK